MTEGTRALITKTLIKVRSALARRFNIQQDGQPTYDYPAWIELYEPRDILEAQKKADTLPYRPLISIIMPVYNTEARFLERAIESVREQAYSDWELCICGDGSTEPHVRPLLNAA